MTLLTKGIFLERLGKDEMASFHLVQMPDLDVCNAQLSQRGNHPEQLWL